MGKKATLFILLSFFYFPAFSQEEVKEPKKTDFYVGLQVNQLIKEIVNLSSNNTPVDNPYILILSVRKPKTGWGIDGGFGYNFENIKDDSDPANHKSEINKFFYRVGISKNVMIAKKWTAGAGIDFAGDYQVDKTTTVSVTDFGFQVDSLVSDVKSVTKSFGGGIRLNLGFHITSRIILGTEATLYYLQSNIKRDVYATEYTTFPLGGGQDSKTETADHVNTNKGTFSIAAPIAIFLSVKF
jgi:hypothetical protein